MTQGYRVTEEATLLDKAVGGDRQAFDELARRYRPHMVARAQVIVGPSDAEDVVQTSLVSAYRALEGGTKPDSFVAWLSTITRNAAISHKRALHAEPLEAGDHARAADDAAIERDEVRRMTVAINELPATERSALIMRELEGRGHLEIAASEGITVGAARMAIHRARVRVRAAVAVLIPIPFLLRPFRWIASKGPSVGVTGAAAAATAAGVAAIAIATGGGGGSGSGGAGEPAGSSSGPPGAAVAAAPAHGGESSRSEDRATEKADQDRDRDGEDRASANPVEVAEPAATGAAPATAAPAPEAQPAPESSAGGGANPEPSPTPPAPPTPQGGGEEPEPEPPPVTEPPPPVTEPQAPPPPPPQPPPTTPTANCNGLVPCVLDLVDGVLGGGQ